VHSAIEASTVQRPTGAVFAGVYVPFVGGWAVEFVSEKCSGLTSQTKRGMSIHEAGFQIGTILGARVVYVDARPVVFEFEYTLW